MVASGLAEGETLADPGFIFKVLYFQFSVILEQAHARPSTQPGANYTSSVVSSPNGEEGI